MIMTILPIFHESTLANVSFQDKVKIKQISFAISVKHLPKKTRSQTAVRHLFE